MARKVALLIAAAYAVLLTVAGLPGAALVFGCVVYLTLTSLFHDRYRPTHLTQARSEEKGSGNG